MLKRKKSEVPEPPGKSPARASNTQGITARGNALYRIVTMALLVMLALVMLGFA